MKHKSETQKDWQKELKDKSKANAKAMENLIYNSSDEEFKSTITATLDKFKNFKYDFKNTEN